MSQEEIKARLEAINKGCRFTHQSVMFLDMEKKGLANDIEWLMQQLREALEREQIAVEALELYAKLDFDVGQTAKEALSKLKSRSKTEGAE